MNTIQHYWADPVKLARELAKIAVRSLYFEVKAHPKPGLVSFVSKGAHHDMDGETFYRSLFSLRHYFYRLIIQDKLSSSFDLLKKIATNAEVKMLAATNGINTHRGAIFALGIFCISAARLVNTKKQFTPSDFHHRLIYDWEKTLMSHYSHPNSHGSQVSKEYVVIGAKEMAMQGYKIIFQILDSFLRLFEETGSLDICCLYAYAEILHQIDDTNILYRKGLSGLKYAKQQAKKLLSIDCLLERHRLGHLLHQEFSEQYISPGGVGDLIGVLLFVGQLFCEKLKCHS
jgi:triphosphoribosyl-dephospho-CoA synthetase